MFRALGAERQPLTSPATRTGRQPISPVLLIGRAAMSRRPVPPIPAKPMPRTGSIFSAWCRRSGLAPLPPHPQTVGLYITACASGAAERGTKANSVSTIERRLSSLSWNYAQCGLTLERKDRHIATVLSDIRKSHARPPVQKEAMLTEDLIAMVETLDRGTLRGLRDRAMLFIGS